MSALCDAAQNGRTEELRSLLTQPGASPDAEDGTQHRWTALHYAAYNNKPESAQILLEFGADIDKRTPGGWFSGKLGAVHIASNAGHVEVLKVLLDQGRADPNSKDQSDWTPLHYAARNSKALACVELLLSRRAAPDEKCPSTALDLALQADNLEAAKLLARASNEETLSKALEETCLRSVDARRTSLLVAEATTDNLPTDRLVALKARLEGEAVKARENIVSETASLRDLEKSAVSLTTAAASLPSLDMNPARVELTKQAEAIRQRASMTRTSLTQEQDKERKRGDVIEVLGNAIMRRQRRLVSSTFSTSTSIGTGTSPPPELAHNEATDLPPPYSPSLPPSSPLPPSSSSECPVCFTAPKNAALVPCGHMICEDCGDACRQSGGGCPVCRTGIERVLRLFG